MEEIRIVPPPLPPKKTRRIAPSDQPSTTTSTTTTTTVLTTSSSSSLPSSLSTTTTTSTSGDVFNYQVEDSSESHVVKIRINPKCDDITTPCIRININNTNNNNNTIMDSGSLFYNSFGTVMSSGQISPSDTLDSGTCSDLDGTPPPLPKKTKSSGITITLIQHKRAPSSSSGNDSDDNDSNISCDSLSSKSAKGLLPPTLLQDIRNIKLNNTFNNSNNNNNDDDNDSKTVIKSYQANPERDDDDDYEEEEQEIKQYEEKSKNFHYETDMFYKFHLNEHTNIEQINDKQKNIIDDDETFAGYKDLLNDGGEITTIRSAKGTVRGVKNRVRAGIATFLQINSAIKSYKEKDAGKVVVYTTTMGILRDTYQACMKVKQILRTLMVKFEERDVFMSNEYQTEIKERMRCNYILVPQVFVDGQHIGDVETIERLNESGELRRILKPFKSADVCSTCKICGGYRLLPCPVCNGSKKSVHRNHFTTEFVALKCMNCDEVGLVRCSAC